MVGDFSAVPAPSCDTIPAEAVGLSQTVYILYVFSVLSAWVPTGQKRAPDLIIDGCEPHVVVGN